MQVTSPTFLTGNLSDFDQQVLLLEDVRAYPTEDALTQLGTVVMNELLDVVLDTGLEDHNAIIAESLIGAFHSCLKRLERDADRARDQINVLNRDFDGSEIADSELQEAMMKGRKLDVAIASVEFIRDAAHASYTAATGEVWTAWTGNVKASRTTAAQIQARDMIRASKAAKYAAVTPGAPVVAFRGSPKADTAVDAARIFDALNWAKTTYPDMVLATTGASGAEKLAAKWARQKGVTIILAAADFDTNGRAAPFKANDEMLQLDPVCCLTLPDSLNPERAAKNGQPFGPALNFGQKAEQSGRKHVRILLKA
nr:DUF2493 domain-containing protein [Paenarthrobacter ureafaciens]